MRISLNWLKEYVDIDPDPDELAHRLTMLGLEIESVDCPGAEVHDVLVGKVLSVEPHPNADKLVVCKTDVGEGEPLQIVCGARNMAPGDKVPTAKVGASLPGGFEISRRKMRGLESFGMMCSARELGVSDDHEGILILDAELPVGDDVSPHLGLDDVVFEIEVTPNRNDWSSMIGVARELSALLGTPLRIPQLNLVEDGEDASRLSSVTIEAPELCPRYAGRVLRGVEIGPSPHWLCRHLSAAGQRPINNVVDVTNYVLLETGHPLHAFDYDKLKENRIVVRTARTGETLVTIDEEERRLSEEMLIIADAQDPVALAGVMGGRDSEVGEGSANIFLESAYFDPVSIRRTSRALGMMTEASQRFQRGADPEMARYAIDRAAQLIHELAGGTIAPGVLDEYPKPIENREIELRYERADLLLGTTIDPAEQRAHLVNLAFQPTADAERSCRFLVPTWRHDCTLEADLIEEIARLHGYDNVPAALPLVRQNETEFAPEEKRVRALRRCLAGSGLTEAMNMTFSSPAEAQRAGLEGDYLHMVMLQNPLSENHLGMRTSLIPGLVGNVQANVRHGSPNVRLFEIGPVYRPAAEADLPAQSLRLGVVLSGAMTGKHWSRAQSPADFYDLKGVLETALDSLAVSSSAVALEEGTMGSFQPGECGRLLVNGCPVAWLGRLRDDVHKAYDLEQTVYIMELDLDPLLELDRQPPRFEAIPAYPPSLRDLAILVDHSVSAGALCNAATKAGGKYLRSVHAFDVYTGEQVPPGKKSVALSLIFQSNERTLTEKVTEKAWNQILKKLQSEFGAELR